MTGEHNTCKTTSSNELNKMELKPSSLDKDHQAPEENVLRRRSYLLSSTAAQKGSTVLPLCSTFVPAVRISRPSSDKGNRGEVQAERQGDTLVIGDRIFSIASTSFFVFISMLVVAVLCVCIASKSSLHVNAYSGSPSGPIYNPGGGGSSDNEARNGPQSSSSVQQTKVHQTLASMKPTSASKSFLVEEKKVRQSIDRFDSGEQIRPPLLRQPTTVPPLSRAQVSVDKAFNLQEAASQDTYLSPEDREQMMRSQESHYEGRNADQQQPGYDSSPGESGELRPAHSYGQATNARQMNRNGNLQPEASSAEAKSNDNDDSDYEDDSASEADRKAASLVPENRRTMTASSANHNQQSKFRGAPVANLDEDTNDDYGSANDDAYFSRKSNPETNQLKQAASYSQQNRGPFEGHGAHSGSHNGRSNSQGDSQGFGPGPNEAYMADKAESDGSGVDSEDPNDGSESSQIGDYEAKLAERRAMMNGEPNSFSTNLRSHRGQPSASRAGDSGLDSESDSDSGADLGDDSGSAYASSSVAAVKSNSNDPRMVNQRMMGDVIPRTSASAPAPLAAPRSASATSGRSSTTVKPVNAGHAYQRQQQMQAPQLASQHYRHPISIDRGISNTIAHGQYGQQNSANAPYNPQNNPSHVGKYFIN